MLAILDPLALVARPPFRVSFHLLRRDLRTSAFWSETGRSGSRLDRPFLADSGPSPSDRGAGSSGAAESHRRALPEPDV